MALALKEDELYELLIGIEPQQYNLLREFVEKSPKHPYCTDEKGEALRIRNRRHAFLKRYVQHNPPAMCHWLTFDLDHGNPMIFKDVTLPAPNLVAMTRDTGRSHISYAIEGVCTSDAARIKPIQYLQAIEDAYQTKLEADISYTNFITKNPLHSDWDITVFHDHTYSLGELADYVELSNSYWTRKKAANDAHHGYGRNCALFHRLRFWSYDHVTWHREEGTSYERWMTIVLERCEQLNDFEQILPYSEIKATAKSVGKWVWTKYWPQGKPIRRGMMADSFAGSQIPLDLKAKQRLSARRTNETRRKSTEDKIIDAIGQITATGKKVTKAAVSRITGLHRKGLERNYGHLFNT